MAGGLVLIPPPRRIGLSRAMRRCCWMSIFVTGDVHGIAEYGASRFSLHAWPLGRTLTRDDVVIVAGDFGFIWSGSNADKYWLDWFESKPWTTCFCRR